VIFSIHISLRDTRLNFFCNELLKRLGYGGGFFHSIPGLSWPIRRQNGPTTARKGVLTTAVTH